jgi:Skp family chaperone for outer membrane proteins
MFYKFIITILLLLTSTLSFGQTPDKKEETIKVVTLGTFHFQFPNLDVVKVEDDEKIDVLSSEYQKQLEAIAEQLKRFNPTHIVVEHKFAEQKKLTEEYEAYLSKRNAELNQFPRNEVYQLGFRLAKKLGHNSVFAADTWGRMYSTVNKVLNDKSKSAEFGKYYKSNPDSELRYSSGKPLYKSQGIAAELLRLNSEKNIKKSLGNYLIGHFKFETEENDYFGADFETGRWFSRNLRIFRNIQRLPAKPGDRILVIFGSGHMNLLNFFFDASPEYEREQVGNYLNIPK